MIYKKNNKGNISIMVIFVLIASSLMGILTTNYIMDMMQYNDIIHGYYKSYYISKAGIELSLTQTNNNGVGFENTINTGSNIFASNFKCNNCDFSIKIKGNSDFFSQNILDQGSCNNPISLSTGNSYIIPLFKQIDTGTNYQKLITNPIYQNMADKLTNLNFVNITPNKELTIGIFIMSGGDILEDGVFVKTGSSNNTNIINNFINDFESYASNINIGNYTLSNAYKNSSSNLRSFILFGNTKEDQNNIEFCIKINPIIGLSQKIELPTSTFFIKSIGNNFEKIIGLEAFLKQPIPDFLIHTYLGL